MSIPTTDTDLFVAVVLDRSGSMESIRDDAIGAFNGFVADLGRQAGKTVMTFTQFDSQSIDVVFDGVPLAEVVPLSRETFVPRGATPLLDAVGQTLARIEHRAAALDWTGSVMVAIITDGMENASQEWTRERLLARIRELEARDWAFSYLGAHADAFHEARAMGIADGATANWTKSAYGAAGMGDALSSMASKWRGKRVTREQLLDDEDRRKMRR